MYVRGVRWTLVLKILVEIPKIITNSDRYFYQFYVVKGSCTCHVTNFVGEYNVIALQGFCVMFRNVTDRDIVLNIEVLGILKPFLEPLLEIWISNFFLNLVVVFICFRFHNLIKLT